MAPTPAPPRPQRRDDAPGWLLGPRWWADGLRQPGWRILPLRVFLGFTFVFAGLQKLANPDYLNPRSPLSVQAQMADFHHTSPIGGLLGLLAHQAGLVGVLIALGEFAVGIGTLVGLWTRVAAAGGALLSLTFLLTVSWHTRPYYYGSDIVFLFAWTVLLAFGAGGVLALDGWIAERARWELRLPAVGAMVPVPAAVLRSMCERGRDCQLAEDGVCGRIGGCPLRREKPLPAATAAELDRRSVLRGGQLAVALAVLGGFVAGITAITGRLLGGSRSATPNVGLPTSAPPSTPAGSPSPTASGSGGSGGAGGRALGPASRVPVGQGAMFTDPASGQPAWVVHPGGNTFLAFSAVCTHAGCTVGFNASAMQFVCPCHGGAFSARTGQVLGGPPPSPLPSIPIRDVAGELRVD